MTDRDYESPRYDVFDRDAILEQVAGANHYIDKAVAREKAKLQAIAERLNAELGGRPLLITGNVTRVNGQVTIIDGNGQTQRTIQTPSSAPFENVLTTNMEFFIMAIGMYGKKFVQDGRNWTIVWSAEVVDGNFSGQYVGGIDDLYWVEADETSVQRENT